MAQYKRTEVKAASRGINLTRPPDLLTDTQPYLRNMRQFSQGVVSARPGMSVINTIALPLAPEINSIIRLNNDLSATQPFTRFVAAAGKLYSDNNVHNASTERASGFFDDPLQFVIMRPLQSPEPWLYIGNLTKNGKARSDGTFYKMGVASPTVPAYAQPAATSIKVIDDMEAVGAWANGGTAGAISAVARIATTISKIVYDTGTTGWATVQPATLDEAIQPGMRLITNSGGGTAETVLVESVSDAVTTTTIAAIQYDGGSTGLCTIQLAAPSNSLARDHLLRINSGGGSDEVVRVLSVTAGPGGLPSLRCFTVNTHAAAESITGGRSFRAFFASNHVATETLASNHLRSSIATGIGYITLVGALDLSVVNSRPITPDDEIHISIKLDDLSLLTEGRISLDVDSATNDFTQNYYWKPFRANDIVPATTSSITTLSAQQRIIQRGQISQAFRQAREIKLDPELRDNFPGMLDPFEGGTGLADPSNPTEPTTPDQTATGAAQWTELRFKVRDLQRVGSDTSRTLHDVAAIRIQLQTTGAVQLDVDAWWIGGTYGADALPDINIGAAYNYRYVYRSSLTGAQSNPSPPMRSGILVKRQRINGTVTASADPQVDQIDIYRTGGTLTTVDGSPPWFYVMTVPNASPTFVDDFPDDVVVRGRQLDFDNWQPFLDRDIPRTGACTVVGTEVTRTGGTDTFNTAWPAGTIITINNVPYSLYASPSSTTALSLSESAGNQTGVVWRIDAPRLQAKPLPAMWGPFGGGIFEPVIFACGSLAQPGHIFWTRPGNADANSQYGALKLTSPSEPLIGGCIFRSQAFVFSSEALYVLTPTVVGGELRFTGTKVAGNRGLYSAYALAVGDEGIFYLSRDGIYLSNGGESICLTDEAIYPLFPHEGAAAVSVNGIAPPNFVFTKNTRLSYGESELYFDFIDTNADRVTLLYDIKLKGWFYYKYTPQISCHYVEEGRTLSTMLMGGTDGFLYLSGGTQDMGTPVSCELWTSRYDGGDPRGNKQWANGMLDFDSGGVDATVKVYADNESVLLNTLTVNKNGRGQQVLDFVQAIHRNALLKITGSSPLFLYGYDWEHVPVSVSELTEQRNAYAASWQFLEYGHLFYAEIAHISTANLTWTITVDNGAPDTYTIPHSSGAFVKTWVVLRARKGKLFDLKFSSANEFQLIPSQSLVFGKNFRDPGAYEPIHCFGDTT